VRDGLVQVPLDVRHDAEVLLDPGAELAALTPSLQRLQEILAGISIAPVCTSSPPSVFSASAASRSLPASQATR